MLRVEHVRLQRLFYRALVAALAVPAGALPVTACSRQEPAPHAADPDGAPVDAGDDGPCAPKLRDVQVTSVDGNPQCEAIWEYQCGLPAGVVPVDGSCSFSLNDCNRICPATGAYMCETAEASCPVTIGVDASVTLFCSFCPNGIGRRPRGLVSASARSCGTSLGDYFARAAELEAASVYAFRILENDLRSIGAPRSLCAAARRAARDETRHARMIAALARSFGGRPQCVKVKKTATHSLLEIARENAVEGCVTETYGALVARWQALHAEKRVRDVLSVIARDEARHAALSWSIARSLSPKLARSERLAIAKSMDSAIDALEQRIAEPDADLRTVAGLPPARHVRALLNELDRSLWRGALL